MPSESKAERAAMAARLKEAREYVGLSQEEVAQILKIPRPAVSLIENGERKVDALELKRLAELYQRSVDYFTGSTLPKASQQVQHLARLSRTASKLKPEDLEELTRFAQFLQAKTNPGKR
jgi:transcriptional regulator with XRE-family HTH domain